MDINLNVYGSIISDDRVGEEVLEKIQDRLSKGENVIIDFSGVVSITTFNAKQIFGSLYSAIGADQFFKRISFKNASKNVVTIIKLGIQDSIAEMSV